VKKRPKKKHEDTQFEREDPPLYHFDSRVAMAIGSESTSTKKLRNSANNAVISPIRKVPQLILKEKIPSQSN